MNKIVDGTVAELLSGRVAGLSRAIPLALVGFAALLLAGCATPPPSSDPEAVAEFNETNDPIEPFNRGVWEFNRGLMHGLLHPL